MSNNQQYSAWLLVDNLGLTLAMRNHSQCLVNMTKRGIPQGCFAFNTEREALDELHGMKLLGKFPLWTGHAKPKLCTWS